MFYIPINYPFTFVLNRFEFMRSFFKIICWAGLASFPFLSQGQYYYKDIVSNLQLQKDMALYKSHKVRNIKIESLEADGLPSPGFYCRKKLNKNYTRSELQTRLQMSGSTWVISQYNEDGQIISVSDSSDISINHIQYEYTQDGLLASVKSNISSSDDDFITHITEEHIYSYNEDGKPTQMLRIKNHSDTALILFALDEHKNVSIEKNSVTGNKYYYYYDNKNRLTEIVEINDFRTQPTPNYIFKYNPANLITEMTVVEEGGNVPDYFIWKYGYEDGLLSSERCYSKQRRLVGSVTYTYQ